MISQPGSRKERVSKEYGTTYDFKDQKVPEKKDAGLPTISEIRTATAICGFGGNADAPGSLSFRAGEDVSILDDSGESWWQGVNDQGDEGWFPKCIVSLGGETQADRERKDASLPSNGGPISYIPQRKA